MSDADLVDSIIDAVDTEDLNNKQLEFIYSTIIYTITKDYDLIEIELKKIRYGK